MDAITDLKDWARFRQLNPDAKSTQRLLSSALQQADAKRNFLNRLGFDQEPSGFQHRMEQYEDIDE
ncbi:MAG: hypothetical protein CL923_00500 [Deltaproteobacteria bacterium]|jgi:hypothetical protein|nr:hypothetical protein [Deltaproteobacteria bacterium]MDP7157899.1 hypothetical protein [SAR324 cluster bacterium]MDP7629382.1 hypothetical protein [SAR324 cluster bacterium]